MLKYLYIYIRELKLSHSMERWFEAAALQ